MTSDLAAIANDSIVDGIMSLRSGSFYRVKKYFIN